MNINSIIAKYNNSGKKNLVITGDRGTGKSRLAKKIVDKHTYTIITEAMIGKQKRTKVRRNIIEEATTKGKEIENVENYMVKPNSVVMMDISKNKTIIIAKRNENSMQADIETLEKEGIEILKNAIESKNAKVLIDEIGFVELKSIKYQEKLMKVFDKKTVVAVIRKMNNSLFDRITKREDTFVIDLDKKN